MEAALARIPARSQRQAMDWSLVLISQGIEPTVEPPAAGSSWALLVPPEDYVRAIDSIRQYRLENRRWRWRRQEFAPGILLDWSCLAWTLLIVFLFTLEQQAGLAERGHMSTTAVRAGEWWRLFTAVWLHADLGHLASNAVFGTLLLGLAMGRFGTGLGLLAAYISGACGNLGALFLAGGTHRSLGASGMVMGCLGLLAGASFWNFRNRYPSWKWQLSGTAGGAMLFVLLGVSPGTDVLAHAGGFLAGLIFGVILGGIKVPPDHKWLNTIAGAAFSILTMLPWWLALRRAGL